MVIGFQYRGHLPNLENGRETKLTTAGITGISDSFKIFKSSRNTGTILVYFSEIGLNSFTYTPANKLFNLSISLENMFDKSMVSVTEEKMTFANTDKRRIHIIERFLLSHLQEIQKDKLVIEAVQLICHSKGTIRVTELAQKLFISQSPLEKRFRKLVGTPPKIFLYSASIRCSIILITRNRSRTFTMRITFLIRRILSKTSSSSPEIHLKSLNDFYRKTIFYNYSLFTCWIFVFIDNNKKIKQCLQ